MAVRGPSFIFCPHTVLYSRGLVGLRRQAWSSNSGSISSMSCSLLPWRACYQFYTVAWPRQGLMRSRLSFITHTSDGHVRCACCTAGQPCAALGCAVIMCRRWDIKHMHVRPDELRVM